MVIIASFQFVLYSFVLYKVSLASSSDTQPFYSADLIPSNFFDINMEEIVKTCYRKFIPLIVITPLAQDALEQGLNATRQKAVDRLKERCYRLTLLNTSRNKQLTKERKEKMEKLLGIGE